MALSATAKTEEGEEMRLAYDDNKSTLYLFFWLWLLSHITFGVLFAIQIGYSARIYKAIEHQTAMMIEQVDETVMNMPEPSSSDTSALAVNATVVAYMAIKSSTDHDPNKTAIIEKPIPGWTCAVSRDLAHWLGGKIWIEGVGVRKVNDLTHRRFERRVDVLVGHRDEIVKMSNDVRKVVFLGKG